jgi:hypothetical protein
MTNNVSTSNPPLATQFQQQGENWAFQIVQGSVGCDFGRIRQRKTTMAIACTNRPLAKVALKILSVAQTQQLNRRGGLANLALV